MYLSQTGQVKIGPGVLGMTRGCDLLVGLKPRGESPSGRHRLAGFGPGSQSWPFGWGAGPVERSGSRRGHKRIVFAGILKYHHIVDLAQGLSRVELGLGGGARMIRPEPTSVESINMKTGRSDRGLFRPAAGNSTIDRLPGTECARGRTTRTEDLGNAGELGSRRQLKTDEGDWPTPVN